MEQFAVTVEPESGTHVSPPEPTEDSEAFGLKSGMFGFLGARGDKVTVLRTAIQVGAAGFTLWYLYDSFAAMPESYRIIMMVLFALFASWIGYQVYRLVGRHIERFLREAVPWF